SGLRVIECSEAYAVPHGMRLLADLGAEVIKIESPTRPDSSRSGAYPEGQPGKEYWNQGSIHHEQNRNKLSFGLNLQTEEGRGIFRDLIRRSDVLAQIIRPASCATSGSPTRRSARSTPA